MINNFTILGERHSGTNLCEKNIMRRFVLPITYDFGNKHFFKREFIGPKENTSNTLFFCCIRNPYDWLLSMFSEPHHCGFCHQGNLIKFLHEEWFSIGPLLGPEILEDRNMYSGERYKNIFELRSVKAEFLHRIIPLITMNNFMMKYEDVYADEPKIIKNISIQYKLQIMRDSPVELRPHKKHYKHMTKEAFLCINNNIDWELENSIGYYPFIDFDQFVNFYKNKIG